MIQRKRRSRPDANSPAVEDRERRLTGDYEAAVSLARPYADGLMAIVEDERPATLV